MRRRLMNNLLYKENLTCAHVLLNVLNELGKGDKKRG